MIVAELEREINLDLVAELERETTYVESMSVNGRHQWINLEPIAGTGGSRLDVAM